MEPETIIQKLSYNQSVFVHLLGNKSTEEFTFKSDGNSWCLLEVACHLLDEEVEDFRARVHHILTTPNLGLEPIAPHNWPIERNYLEKDFENTVDTFISERQKSVDWLSSLKNPNWLQTVDHPKVGPRSAKKFLVNWLAHDYHHIRQINRINYSYLQFLSEDDLTYAGEW